MSLELTNVPSSGSLDSITVYWQNFESHRGQVTIACWGSSWTAFFGAMPKETIQQFFLSADIGYLVNKLGCTRWIKQTKAHDNYLARICEAIKKNMQAASK